MNRKRRHFIGAAGAVGIAAAAGWSVLRSRTAREPVETLIALPPDPLFPNALQVPGDSGLHGIADIDGAFTMVSRAVRHAIVPGKPTPMLAYSAEHLGRTFVNPLLRFETGATVRIRYWNALDEPSIVHWHGLKVDTNNDGHPHYAVDAGDTYDYQFTVSNRAGTYWYHPHPHHLAGKQAYLGLAGLLIVEDDEEKALADALDLELGVTDIPLLIQDKRIDAQGALMYSPHAQEQFHGYCGDTVLVNLTPAPCFDCATRLYRFRLVNGSNARIYRLAFMQGEEALEFHTIGADGGLLERPVLAREVFLAPSERADVLLDLRSSAPGDRIVLSSLPFDAMQFSSTSGAVLSDAAGPPNGAPMDLMLIRVSEIAQYERAVPEVLSRIDATNNDDAAHRLFTLDQAKGIWHINGVSYRMTETAFAVKRGAREIWEFQNPSPAMTHPVHVHGFQYRVLERANSPAHIQRLAVDGRGLLATEVGWKDSVLLWPGEKLKMLIDFSHHFSGDQVYMLQCHNLEHETRGMMVNFRVAA